MYSNCTQRKVRQAKNDVQRLDMKYELSTIKQTALDMREPRVPIAMNKANIEPQYPITYVSSDRKRGINGMKDEGGGVGGSWRWRGSLFVMNEARCQVTWGAGRKVLSIRIFDRSKNIKSIQFKYFISH